MPFPHLSGHNHTADNPVVETTPGSPVTCQAVPPQPELVLQYIQPQVHSIKKSVVYSRRNSVHSRPTCSGRFPNCSGVFVIAFHLGKGWGTVKNDSAQGMSQKWHGGMPIGMPFCDVAYLMSGH